MENDVISSNEIEDIIKESEKEKESSYLTKGSGADYKLQNKMPPKIASVLLDKNNLDKELEEISNIINELDS